MVDTFENRVRTRLKDLDLSMRAASLRAEKSADFVRNIFRNPGQMPQGRNMALLAKALEVSPMWLATGDGPMSPSDGGGFSALSVFESDDDLRVAVYQASHEVLSVLQRKPFDYDLSDRDVSSLALTISKTFTRHNGSAESQLESMTSDLLREREIRKLEG